MYNIAPRAKMVIIGGGPLCETILKLFLRRRPEPTTPTIVAVIDEDEDARCMYLAKENGIFATTDIGDLFEKKRPDVVIDLTQNVALAETIQNVLPTGGRVIDHFEAALLINFLRIDEEKIKAFEDLDRCAHDLAETKLVFSRFADRAAQLMQQRYDYSTSSRQELIASQRAMYHIVQGSTIPTFVINADHIITHWNNALEGLSGHSAQQMVGTNKQWMPFWENKRPSMADVILDEIGKEKIEELYGQKWQPSALIEGAYEAEVFFPKLGTNGKWCFFTAAPIKDHDGKAIGAIETLWDTTEEKKAKEEGERHNRELSALLSIYSALGSSLTLEESMAGAVNELFNYLAVDSVCVFLSQAGRGLHLHYAYGHGVKICQDEAPIGTDHIVNQVVKLGELLLYEKLAGDDDDSLGPFIEQGIKSIAFIPLRGKAQSVFGVLQIGSRKSGNFSAEQKNVLELIGNRIGAAIENSRLYEKYRKSEEKYRSLFNNDPNPIFIIDSKALEILDLNRRAQECYQYERDEMLGMPFLQIGDKDDSEMATTLTKLAMDQSVLISRKRHFRKSGASFFVNINVCHADYSARDVLIATTTDITESVEKETQLVQASKMTTLGVMAAGMAHEINQPLNVIQVSADLLLKMIHKNIPIGTPELKTIAGDIGQNVERAAGIIKHMRDFSRLSEGIRQQVNLNGPINDVFKVLGHQLKVHQVALSLDLDPDLPYILAEHNRLEQVFINLVTNALDAMDERGKSDSSATWKKELNIKSFTENKQVVVSVTDTGSGMTQEIIDKIFEPFFTTKEIGRGTGLGVSISYGIVKDYDGTIAITSDVGVGTTFELRFPVAG
jgi:PAS domain S-box-containing protein